MRIATEQGYDVESGKLQGIPPKANGKLSIIGDTKNSQNLWVYEVQTGFALNGSTGQSLNTRSFYPRNRVQSSLTVMCQCPNQAIYGNIIEWIRSAQISRSNKVLIEIINKYIPIKGLGPSFSANGYIVDIARTHKRFEYAPELTFNFVVAKFNSPSSFADSPKGSLRARTPSVLPSWKAVIEQGQKGIPDPDDGLQNPLTPLPPSGSLMPYLPLTPPNAFDK